jgi:hypothetical protein
MLLSVNADNVRFWIDEYFGNGNAYRNDDFGDLFRLKN